jgi:imidazolonepropionase
MKRNIPLVLATDFNPGTSPSLNMNFVIALACIQMKLTAEQALNAATINAAFALELQHELGSIAVGKRAQLIVTKPMRSYWEIPYYFGNNPIEKVLY